MLIVTIILLLSFVYPVYYMINYMDFVKRVAYQNRNIWRQQNNCVWGEIDLVFLKQESANYTCYVLGQENYSFSRAQIEHTILMMNNFEICYFWNICNMHVKR